MVVKPVIPAFGRLRIDYEARVDYTGRPCLSQWLRSVILASWEAEIRRKEIRGQSGQLVRPPHLQK
jgi:hypothetical protein